MCLSTTFYYFFELVLGSNRSRRDLNPRAGFPTYTLSRGASSASWVLLHSCQIVHAVLYLGFSILSNPIFNFFLTYLIIIYHSNNICLFLLHFTSISCVYLEKFFLFFIQLFMHLYYFVEDIIPEMPGFISISGITFIFHPLLRRSNYS